jgi:hypothetical protein
MQAKGPEKTENAKAGAKKPAARSSAMERQMARLAVESEKVAAKATAAGNSQPKSLAKVAGQVKPVLSKKSSAAAPRSKATGPTPEELKKRNRGAQYKALADPVAQAARKQQYLEAFSKLKVMSMDELQVEFIVCIRAQHYRDALMYSEIMLEKDPKNALVAQFQPLLASMAVQVNERLCESSDSGSDVTDGDDGSDGEGESEDDQGETIGGDGEDAESDSDSDDTETAWMWSDTWRTDPDDDEPFVTDGPTSGAAPKR